MPSSAFKDIAGGHMKKQVFLDIGNEMDLLGLDQQARSAVILTLKYARIKMASKTLQKVKVLFSTFV